MKSKSAVRFGVILATAASLAGCPHSPAKLDAASGLYETSAELDRGATLQRDLSVDPRSFEVVLLAATSNFYPARLEFLARSALADLGFLKVVSAQELVAFTSSHPKLKDIESIRDLATLRRIGEVTGPILYVDFNSTWDGGDRRYVRLRLLDVNRNKILLAVEQPRMVWLNADREAHYPVLNALRDWFKQSAGTRS